ncbi:glycosyltransferase family 2 protein [Formosa sp. 3Alg 14/1]|uniref:glycosyltransferase family 2 protein n=1 Tax=Formosa sp. 3Alg 14/1 TaxID=3382190 RepID=UPI0039BDC54B
MKLSVVILNYNVCHFLELCLKSVVTATSKIDAEIIVVDNQSSDDSCHMIKTRFPEVTLIENTANYGFSKGNNIGVSRAKGEYVCILNPDTVVTEDTFLSVLKFADKQDRLGIVGCKLIDGTGAFLPESKRYVPTPAVALKKILGDTDSYYVNTIEENAIGPVPILVGAFMIIKRHVYNAVNGFDEDFFMYGEDIDLSYKILKAGFQNFYFGATTVIHFKGESTCRNKDYAKRFNGAMQIFYKKHFSKNLLLETLISLVVKGLIVLNLQPSIDKRDVKSIVMVSNRKYKLIESVLPFSLIYKSKIEEVADHQQLILDNNMLTFRQIVSILEIHANNKTLTYRILPRESDFLIGSDNAVSKGIVIHF